MHADADLGVTVGRPLSLRLRLYLAERLPAAGDGVLAFAMAAAAVIHGAQGPPTAQALFVALIGSLLLAFQARACEDFADLEEDRRMRPERPLPRGLMTAGELKALVVGAGCVEAALALMLHGPLLALLALTWGFFALQAAQFLAPNLSGLAKLAARGLSLPLIALFAAACGIFPQGGEARPALLGLLGAVYVLGLAVEASRQIKAPQEETKGAQSLSARWGAKPAGLLLAGLIALSLFAAMTAFLGAPRAAPFIALVAIAAFAAFFIAARFADAPSPRRASLMEGAAWLHALLVYLCVGALPVLAEIAARSAPPPSAL